MLDNKKEYETAVARNRETEQGQKQKQGQNTAFVSERYCSMGAFWIDQFDASMAWVVRDPFPAAKRGSSLEGGKQPQ